MGESGISLSNTNRLGKLFPWRTGTLNSIPQKEMDQITEASSIPVNEDTVLWVSQEGDPEIHTFSHDSWLSIALGASNTVSMATTISSMPLGP